MDLILWRHAEAHERSLHVPDRERPLTSRGRLQSLEIGAWLKPRLPHPVRVLASPSVRTCETAEGLGIPFGLRDELGTETSVDRFLFATGWPDEEGCVVAVGHQPTLGQVASTILTGEAHLWTVQKGALWWFRIKRPEGGNPVLRLVLSPGLL
ncbi:MAG: SixA phosphatase family protein [Leptospirales bacterium]